MLFASILRILHIFHSLYRVKQLKAKEATTSMRSTLPLRLRLFENFPSKPEMVRVKRVESEVSTYMRHLCMINGIKKCTNFCSHCSLFSFRHKECATRLFRTLFGSMNKVLKQLQPVLTTWMNCEHTINGV